MFAPKTFFVVIEIRCYDSVDSIYINKKYNITRVDTNGTDATRV